jgi:hypothetical protein
MWHKIDDDQYKHDDGSTVQREYGKTPEGNDFNGRWVFRNKDGEIIDFNKYRSDLCSKWKIKLEPYDCF